jgi:dTDP-4-amino-4,6-dideoxygalactose transaminase
VASALDRYRAVIGQALEVDPANVSLFAKGRVAFYAILKALGVGPGDEVVVPAFTCVAVPNAILYTGARPVWVDIDPTTLCIDPEAFAAALSTRTRAVLAQNTFGLSADLESIETIAGRHGITVVDDCTHGLGGRYHGQPNGATASFSFFSTQWSKPVSTGLGGFAVDRDGAVAGRLREIEATAARPSPIRVGFLRGLLAARELAGGGAVFRRGRAAYRSLSRLGVTPASSDRDELDGSIMPSGFLAGLSEWQARLGSERVARVRVETARRRAIALRYSEWLRERGLTAAAEPPGIEHAFLRYPLRVADRPSFVRAARGAGIDLGDWFVSPVHPVVDRLERWDYTPGTAPIAEGACREIVNLPTEPSLTEPDVDRVIGLLNAQAGLVL